MKICGITRLEDARTAVSQGADALGFVFYPPSPRAITADKASEIIKQLPPFVTVVALFVNEAPEAIEQILSQVRIDLLQFHGDETPDECQRFHKPYMKAVRMREGIDLHAMRDSYADAGALLLDSYRKGVPGGTGERFEWDRIPEELAGDIVLAGGLGPENIEQAILEVQPYAVDVSGGVEKAKGIKDAEKIAAFMRGVESANRKRDC